MTTDSTPTSTSPDATRAINATSSELQNSKYSSSNIQKALEALNQDGLVVLKGVVDVQHVEKLNAFMTKEADELVKNKTKPFNQGVRCRISFRMSVSRSTHPAYNISFNLPCEKGIS